MSEVNFNLATLQKGEFYTVSEMCVDGWYKGQSLRLGKSGVFPGNHVHQVDPGAKSVKFSLSILPVSATRVHSHLYIFQAKKTKDAKKKSVQEVNTTDVL